MSPSCGIQNAYHTKVIEELKAAAPSLSIELSFVSARTPEEFDSAFSAISRAHAQALYVSGRPLLLGLSNDSKPLFKARLPSIQAASRFAEEGGLMSYGPNHVDMFRRSAGYVDKILKGAKPGDLPIEQPTKFELVVNLKTAKALGSTFPSRFCCRRMR